MFALGCVQALVCNNNECPTGITTQNVERMEGLVVEDKAVRVRQYQAKTVHTALEIVGACGLDSPSKLRPFHVWRRHSGFDAENFHHLPRREAGRAP